LERGSRAAVMAEWRRYQSSCTTPCARRAPTAIERTSDLPARRRHAAAGTHSVSAAADKTPAAVTKQAPQLSSSTQ